MNSFLELDSDGEVEAREHMGHSQRTSEVRV